MDVDRFANILGEEYNIFKVSMPHYDDFQDQIGEIIKNYSASLRSDSISVVEGGSGTGLTTLRILEADKRVKVIGIDNEERTLNHAGIILKEYGNRVDLKHDDLLKALKGMPDNCADIFASAWVIHSVPSEYRTRLFPEIARILKTGGLFVNGDKYAQDIKLLMCEIWKNKSRHLMFLMISGGPT